MTAPADLPTDVAVLWVDYQGSDWLGIYVSGEKVYEGHPPSLDDALDLLGIPVVQRTFNSDHLAQPGSRGLPRLLPRTTE